MNALGPYDRAELLQARLESLAKVVESEGFAREAEVLRAIGRHALSLAHWLVYRGLVTA